MEFNGKKCQKTYGELGKMCGIVGATPALSLRCFISALVRLRKDLGLASTLKEAGIAPEKLKQYGPQLVQTALADPCMATNPILPTAQQLLQLLQSVK